MAAKAGGQLHGNAFKVCLSDSLRLAGAGAGADADVPQGQGEAHGGARRKYHGGQMYA